MAKLSLVLSVFLFFIIGSVYAIEMEGKIVMGKTKLLQYLYGECLAICEDKVKQEEACPIFCDFVNHLYNHDPNLFSTLTTKYSQDKNVMSWALTELTNYMLQTKEDDQHTLAMTFRDYLVKWGEFKAQSRAAFGDDDF